MAQAQLGNFLNNGGLRPAGDTTWLERAASGQPIIGVPLTCSLGSITAGGLEQSNDDITTSLVALITAQRNFQANAQSIRTGDAVTQTVINLR